MTELDKISQAIQVIRDDMYSYEVFHDRIISLITRNPKLKNLVHSHKSRFKDLEHLKEKIIRKNEEDAGLPKDEQQGEINSENIKKRITDICGIRMLHLYIDQIEEIHNTLLGYVEKGEIFLFEQPKAYTWDPEYSEKFKNLGLIPKLKPSFYTSVHYVFKAREDSDITCEVQVRTLFEEVWGEIDHKFNYPKKSENKIIQEQLKVLARVVGAGTRLSDSIFSLTADDIENK